MVFTSNEIPHHKVLEYQGMVEKVRTVEAVGHGYNHSFPDSKGKEKAQYCSVNPPGSPFKIVGANPCT